MRVISGNVLENFENVAEKWNLKNFEIVKLIKLRKDVWKMRVISGNVLENLENVAEKFLYKSAQNLRKNFKLYKKFLKNCWDISVQFWITVCNFEIMGKAVYYVPRYVRVYASLPCTTITTLLQFALYANNIWVFRQSDWHLTDYIDTSLSGISPVIMGNVGILLCIGTRK